MHLFTLPQSLQCVESFHTMVYKVFDGIAPRDVDAERLMSNVIITTPNYRMPKLNNYVGHMIPGAYCTNLSVDKVGDKGVAVLQ